MQSLIENLTNTETKKQAFLVAPPPSLARKRKDPGDCYSSFIDQIQGGLYSSSKLVRNEPRKTSDTYFVIKTRATEVRSYRRNYSHKSIALFRTKAGGPKRSNIEYMNCSFLEIDGTNDNKIKTQGDVLALIAKNNLPTASVLSQTSSGGNFHIMWDYSRPLPFTSKLESYWTSQQRRLIKLFEQGGFLVDKGASLNPCQNLRNPSQLNPYNYKRRCEVFIHKTFKKTSLRLIYKALNRTSVANPRPIRASVKLRCHNRANKTFITTNVELAETLGTCTKTAQREVSKAIANGDLQIVRRIGNNHGTKRATEYLSNLYIEPNSQEGHLSISKNNSVRTSALLTRFKSVGAEKGKRQKTLFALGLEIKAQLGKRACIEAIRGELEGGAMRCHVSEKEFERTLKNIMKPVYTNPFSLAKLREWGLLEELKHLH